MSEKGVGFFCGFNIHETERLPGAEKVEAEAEARIKAGRDQIRARRIAEYNEAKKKAELEGQNSR
jgi:hypothetical protein